MAEPIRRGAARRLGLRPVGNLITLAAVVFSDGRRHRAVASVSPALTWRRNGRPRHSEIKGRTFLVDERDRAVHNADVVIGAGAINTAQPPFYDWVEVPAHA